MTTADQRTPVDYPGTVAELTQRNYELVERNMPMPADLADAVVEAS